MNNKLVSIITPAYNAEQYIDETLNSVLASSYSNIEVVVVDDGSTDSTAAIVEQHAARDPRVRLIRQSNAGACRARNNAIENARGYYILPVDADDLIMPWLVEELVRLIESKPGVKVVMPRGEFFGARSGPWKLPAFSLKLLARRNMICATALYRREEWERVGGYDEEIIALEDWAFWTAVLKDGGDVLTTERVGLRYRIHAGSKRIRDRKYKHHVIDTLNKRHPEFYQRVLGGPLRYHRTWSRLINRFTRAPHKWL